MASQLSVGKKEELRSGANQSCVIVLSKAPVKFHVLSVLILPVKFPLKLNIQSDLVRFQEAAK